ncbi:MAG: hypothetical protein O7G31_08510 [Calditrichaeota bacterium]|nr:hypothetical protein [Calditrichota bacterium]
MRRIDLLTEELEKTKLGGVAEAKYESRYGMGPAASRVYQLEKSGVSIAGYGEVIYENFSTEQDNGTPSGKANSFDFLRHVTYLGFRFNDWLLFNAEIEFEHAKTASGSPGSVSIEFGYIEAQLSPAFNIRAGMVLPPLGIINELHEPPTYHGVLRPETEQRIIPTTWRANGFGILGESSKGLAYKLFLTESLNAAKFSSNGIRGGRQNGAKAIAEDLGISGRLNYTGIPGLDFGGSFFLGNTGQTLVDSSGKNIDISLKLFSLHLIFARKGLELRGLYAQSHISDVAALNAALGLSGTGSVGETQHGFYVTAAYDILPLVARSSTHYLAPFIQYEKFDTQQDVPTGFSRNPMRERTNLTLGLTYKPHPNIALKMDYLNRDNKANTTVDQFNLAVTYLF